MSEKPDINLRALLRCLFAGVLTVVLLVFLAGLRLAGSPDPEIQVIRTLDTVSPVSLPEPPPPPAEQPPPPPEMQEELPRLDIALDTVAPPIKATTERKLDLDLPPSDFAETVDRPRQRMTFTSSDLDDSPRLVYRPEVDFPEALEQLGIEEGKVTFDILITSEGNVRVLRVLESDYPQLVAVARSYVSRFRFSPPQRGGRAVNAAFKLPVILRL